VLLRRWSATPTVPDATEAPKRGRKPKERAETVNARGAALKERRRAQGLERVEVWVKPEHKDKIRALARELSPGIF
jgi:hypothetical protein